MDITAAVLAQQAEVQGDLLNLTGAGWAWWDVPALPADLTLQVALVITSELGGVRDLVVRLAVAGPDGEYLDESGAEILIGAPQIPSPVEGQPAMQSIAVAVRARVTDTGRHTVVVFVDNEDTNRASIPFAVKLDPAAATA